MHYAFRYTLAIEMSHLLEELKVFKYDGAARANCKRILVVADGTSGSGR
jgi:hypothetical protein